MLIKSLRNFSFPSLPSPPIPFSFHMINLIGLCPLKTKSLLCLGFPCTDNCAP